MRSSLITCKRWMTKGLEVVLIVAVGLLVLDVVWGVFTRYLMGEQAKWTEELARFLLVWVSLLGGAVAFGTKGHLGVDFFVGKFHPETRKLMVVVVHLIVLFFCRGSVPLRRGTRRRRCARHGADDPCTGLENGACLPCAASRRNFYHPVHG